MIALTAVLLATLLIWGIGLANAGANWGGAHLNWLDGWLRLLCRGLHRLPKQALNLPDSGPAIVVANHVSGLDPLLLIAICHRPLRFLIARDQYERPVVNWLYRKVGCIPVDREGRPEVALRQALNALKAGEVIGLFPHGGIHLDHESPRKLKGGFARLAAWTQAPVFPVRIDGVAGQGKVLTALLMPSRAKLTCAAPLRCQPETIPDCIQTVAQHIEASSPEKQS